MKPELIKPLSDYIITFVLVLGMWLDKLYTRISKILCCTQNERPLKALHIYCT